MNVLLIVPPVENKVRYLKGWQFEATEYGTFPPLGLLYIATVLKQEFPETRVKIIDCPSQRIDYQALHTMIREFAPDLVGITAFTVCLFDVRKVAQLVKRINALAHVCVGGPHLTVYHQQTLLFPEVDSIVIGEGEEAFAALVRRLQGKNQGEVDGLYIKNSGGNRGFKKAIVEDINALPFFDAQLIDEDIFKHMVGKYHSVIPLFSSRGCPYSCTFCDTAFKVYRGRSVRNILEEMKMRRKEGFERIFFFDDTFNITPERVITLSKQMISEKLKFKWSFRARANSVTFEMLRVAKKAGCEVVRFGIETGTDEGLRELCKGITVAQINNVILWSRKLGMQTIGEFMIGLPFERSRAEVIENIKRLVAFGPDYAVFNVLQPVPGSEIYAQGVKAGLIDSKLWENFVVDPTPDFIPPLWTRYLSREELSELFYAAHKMFYLRPKRIVRNILALKSLSELHRAVQAGSRILFKR